MIRSTFYFSFQCMTSFNLNDDRVARRYLSPFPLIFQSTIFPQKFLVSYKYQFSRKKIIGHENSLLEVS